MHGSVNGLKIRYILEQFATCSTVYLPSSALIIRPMSNFARSGAVFTVTSRNVRDGVVSVMVFDVDSVTLSGAGMCVGSVGFSFFFSRRKSFMRLIILAAGSTALSNLC